MSAPFKAYWTQVHPIFMAAALQAGLAGSLFYENFNLYTFFAVSVGIFSALYYAHVKDSYIDYYVRHEDRVASLTKYQSKLGMRISMVIFFLSMVYLYAVSGWLIIPLMFGGLFLAYTHAPYLDMNPFGATAGYPTGLALATLAGYYSQSGLLNNEVLIFSSVVWMILNGVKIIDDIKDYEWDKSFGKRTAVVALGKKNAKIAGCGLVMLGATIGIALSFLKVFSVFSSIAFAFLYPFALFAINKNKRKEIYGLRILLVGVYLFTITEIFVLLSRI